MTTYSRSAREFLCAELSLRFEALPHCVTSLQYRALLPVSSTLHLEDTTNNRSTEESTYCSNQRIGDKDMEFIDMDRLFEQYVETDMFQITGEYEANYSNFHNPVGFTQTPFLDESEIFEIEPILDRDAEPTWHKALPKRKQCPNVAFPDSSSPISIDLEEPDSLIESEIFFSENFVERERHRFRPLSQPSTPRTRSKRKIKKAFSFNDRFNFRGNQNWPCNPQVDSTVSMRQPSYGHASAPNIRPANTRDSPKSVHRPVSSSGMISPSLSSEIDQTGNEGGFYARNIQPYPNIYPAFHDNDYHLKNVEFHNSQSMPHLPRASEASLNRNSFSSETIEMGYSASDSNAALSALRTPPSSLSLPATRWGFDTSPKSEFAFSASSSFPGAVPMADMWHDGFAGHYAYHQSQSPATSQSTDCANEAMSGLGISCDAMRFADYDLAGVVGEEVHGVSASSLEMDCFSTLQPTPQQQCSIPLESTSLSRSPSPFPQPHFHRRRSSVHAQSSHRNRRKSSNSSLLQCKQSEKRVTERCINKEDKKEKLEAKFNSDQMGFVNFTPEDRKKILTGVAPSGSSKTKARREKEAADKRRRLSQVAVKAVIEACGD